MTTTARQGAAKYALSVKMAAQSGKASQADMGAWLGISRVNMANKLAGRIRFNLDEVYALGELFGVEPGDMVAGAGEWLNAIEPSAVRERLNEVAGQSLIADSRRSQALAWTNGRTAICGVSA